MYWPPTRTFLKYIVIQIPGWLGLVGVLLLLWRRVEMPAWAAGTLLGCWVVKDLALYPFLRQSYEGDPRTGVERMVGLRGVVTTDLTPEGYVRVRGELWRARAPTGPVPRGSTVEVVSAADRLTLEVERVPVP